MKTIEQQRHLLAEEKSELEKRRAKLCVEHAQAGKRLAAIEDTLLRLSFVELAATGGEVQMRDRDPRGQGNWELNDATGKLVAVHRSNAIVDFGGHGKKRVPFSLLKPAGDGIAQGEPIGGGAR